MNPDLIRKVESLKQLLVSHATGGSPNASEYQDLRGELLAVPKVVKLLPRFIHECRDTSEFWSFIKSKFTGSGSYEQRRNFLRIEFNPLLTSLESESRAPSDTGITATLQSVNSTFIQNAWQKALERRVIDPEGAITAARTLLESVCKHILDGAGTSYEDSFDLPRLYSLSAKNLNLSPSQHSEQLFRQILGGCQAVVEGLGSLRNRHGDAHGKGAAGSRPATRHAELAVNLSGAMATFLLQTLESRKK